jgi:hypothetical protein
MKIKERLTGTKYKSKFCSPAYGVYISQLIRYTRACSAYENFSKRGQQLTQKLMLQGCNESR